MNLLKRLEQKVIFCKNDFKNLEVNCEGHLLYVLGTNMIFAKN